MTRRREIALAALLLGLSFGLQVMSARLKSPTYDEQVYIAHGYAYVKLGDQHVLTGAPILLNAITALPLLSLPDVSLPVDDPAWTGTDFHPISEHFMWEVNDNADQITFLARVPIMLLQLLLIAFCYRWARDVFGAWGGLLTLTLAALDPNLIAHGRIAATDLGTAALLFIATYWLWRLLRRPSWGHLVATGCAFGLAQGTKFSALLFIPIFALLYLLRSLSGRPFVFPAILHRYLLGDRLNQPWWRRAGGLTITGLLMLGIAGLALWAVYGFDVGPVEGLTAWPVPAAAHVAQYVHLSGRLQGQEGRQATAFLMGELYVGGHWAYFPVAFVLKTPLPTLTFLTGAALLSIRKRIGRYAWALWVPPVIFFGVSLSSELNLGYRYVLPVLPFVLVFAGRMGPWIAEGLASTRGQQRVLLGAAATAMIGWSVWSGLSIYPHYLAYFNELAGGPDNGWRYLVDANIDWGQDLKGLKRWMERHGVDRVKLGYYGEGHPAYYGIDFEPLPSAPDRWEHPFYHELYDADPAPGLYAISANLIQGRALADPETYAWFRVRDPIDKVGYSIFIYDVPKRGEGSAVVSLSGLVPADIRPEDYARLGTNDVRVLWSDVRRALAFPVGADRAYAFVADGAEVHPAIAQLWSPSTQMSLRTRDGRSLDLFTEPFPGDLEAHLDRVASSSPAWLLSATRFAPGDPENHGERLGLPLRFGDPLALLGYEIDRTSMRPGETLTVVTYWRVQAPAAAPLKLFVHLLSGDGSYQGGEDRLDVWHDAWMAGDRFAQVQEVVLDPAATPGEYQLEIGWYEPETMGRLSVMRDGIPICDRVLLHPLTVK